MRERKGEREEEKGKNRQAHKDREVRTKEGQRETKQIERGHVNIFMHAGRHVHTHTHTHTHTHSLH